MPSVSLGQAPGRPPQSARLVTRANGAVVTHSHHCTLLNGHSLWSSVVFKICFHLAAETGLSQQQVSRTTPLTDVQNYK